MFNEAYKLIEGNAGQKQAVDTTEGPVLVVAGPGTGKTQLLSLRVGKILQNNPTILPSNILCLTFTDSAAANLRERLIHSVGLGQDAYQVAIHTFNSFGSWIMNAYPEYFGHWREATVADELTTYRLLEDILDGFPGNHPLAGKAPNGEYIFLGAIQKLIGDSKRANLPPSELQAVLLANGAAYDNLSAAAAKYWPKAMRGSEALASVSACLDAFEALPAEAPAAGVASVVELARLSLQRAAAESEALPDRSKSKPFTTWKNEWLELDETGNWTLKAVKHQEKLLAACVVYERYQRMLLDKNMVDFSDQIMSILAALKEHDDLRLNLQERFQYLMIDEYQDTNRAQLQLAQYLTDAAVHEGRPNILAVGDDDQAIYRFQGADISNIQAFHEAYKDPLVITLQENYRSIESIIAPAKALSSQITTSLANTTNVDKQLNPHVEATAKTSGTQLIAANDESSHYAWIAAEIAKLVADGHDGSDIAVLARERRQLDALVPYLREQSLPINYERRENVLEQPHIVTLITLARFVDAMSRDEPREAAALLPEILSNPMWGIEPATIWRISQDAHASKRHWFDVIFDQPKNPVYAPVSFLYQLALQAKELPLEQALDSLIGSHEAPDGGFTSPFKTHYFSEQLFAEEPGEYLTFLSHLSCLRRHLRDHQAALSGQTLHLHDFLEYVDAFTRAGLTMIDTAAHREREGAINLMTVHKAKGMEFDTVFVIGLVDAVWSKGTAGSGGRFSYPANLVSIKPDNNELEDALRLLFVAMTRAKQQLKLCYYKKGEDGKTHEVFAPLIDSSLEPIDVTMPVDALALTRQYEARWLTRHIGLDQSDMQALLGEQLASYKLSATHMNNFLDVTRGGPAYFLTQNLLRFPAAQSPYASYGSAVHAALRYAHEVAAQGGTPSLPKVLAAFQAELAKAHLSEYDAARFLQRGNEALPRFFATHSEDFTSHQKTEVDMSHDGATAGEALLRGMLDVLELNETTRTLTITDYKTGSSFSSWASSPSTEEHTKIKQHHYRQQLLFYKLLVDSSSQWGKQGWQATTGRLQFVEPNSSGKIVQLELPYDREELERFERLVGAVWQKITTLDFPDTSSYEPTLAGILQFEEDLLNGKI